MRRTLGIVGLCAALGLVIAVPAAFAQSESGPTLTSSSRTAEFGDQLSIRGEGWEPNSIVNISICGNDAGNGTSDCDIVNGRVIGVSNRGTFGASLVVGQPPAPCPCVVRAESQTAPEVVSFDLEIKGAPVLSPDQQFQVPVPDRRLTISNARIDGRGPWYSFLGGPARRDVVFTVENIGEVTVKNAAITLAIGKGPNPKGFVEAPDLGVLLPGESRTYSVPVSLPVLAIGTYGVQGSIPGFTDPVRFRAETSQVPWGLAALPLLILVQMSLIAARNRLRARIAGQRAIAVPTAIVPPPLALPVAATIDLTNNEEAAEQSHAEPVDDEVHSAVAGDVVDPAEITSVTEIGDDIAGAVRLALEESSLRADDSDPDEMILGRIARDVSRMAALRIGVKHSLTTDQVETLERDIHDSLIDTIGAPAHPQHAGT